MAKNTSKKNIIETRINNEITGYNEVRVIYNKDNENFNKIVSLTEAFNISNELEMDLIEINANITPPILKIDYYDKWLYNEKKKLKNNKPKKVELKEIKLSANIGSNDLDVKLKQTRQFIENGDKVKVSLILKGREKQRKEECKKSLFEFLVNISDVAIPETMPKDMDNNIFVILKKKK